MYFRRRAVLLLRLSVAPARVLPGQRVGARRVGHSAGLPLAGPTERGQNEMLLFYEVVPTCHAAARVEPPVRLMPPRNRCRQVRIWRSSRPCLRRRSRRAARRARPSSAACRRMTTCCAGAIFVCVPSLRRLAGNASLAAELHDHAATRAVAEPLTAGLRGAQARELCATRSGLSRARRTPRPLGNCSSSASDLSIAGSPSGAGAVRALPTPVLSRSRFASGAARTNPRWKSITQLGGRMLHTLLAARHRRVAGGSQPG